MANQPPDLTQLTSQSDKPLGGGTALLCLLLGFYLVVVATVALVGIYDIRANDFALAKSLKFTVPTAPETLADVRIALLTMLGASLGACLLSFLGLFQHAVLTANFNHRFFGSYLVGPIAVVFLGLAVFILARAGLFVFGNVGDTTKITPNNELSFLGLGILVGFSWNHVLTRIAELGAQIFASTKQPISTTVDRKAQGQSGEPRNETPAAASTDSPSSSPPVVSPRQDAGVTPVRPGDAPPKT
jgi:hypothetical protein